ncbi:MAG: 6-phosphogluconolactonase [Chloroflexi bacterium]|nr:6-phosphogluconolactonase [Chloroflexota bacterium]MBU1748761.1 6-phosphogluconolactonase [Chloroflexota bacterium]MBU1879576.1 6-phosphogluconolactonase [Chloroflexota bacterium]
MADIVVQPDPAALARAVVEHVVARAQEAIADCGQCTVALAGGSTPRAAYALLATEEFAGRVDWPRLHVFWGDERCVPPDHPDSNYRMARETLLDHVPIPAGNVHRIPGEQEPIEAAVAYESELRAFFAVPSEGGSPRFDLILLGLGDDGHTASLFPGTAAIHEPVRWVVAHRVDKLGAWRVTLTPIVINAGAQVTFVVSGAGKAERLHKVLAGPYQPDVLPAQIVQPTTGCLLWLIDAAAGGQPRRGGGPGLGV